MHTYMSRCEQTKTDTSLHAACMYLNSRPHTRTHECLIACTRTQNVCPSQSCQAAEDFTRALQHGGGQTGCAKEQKRSGRQGCLSAKISVPESRTCMKSSTTLERSFPGCTCCMRLQRQGSAACRAYCPESRTGFNRMWFALGTSCQLMHASPCCGSVRILSKLLSLAVLPTCHYSTNTFLCQIHKRALHKKLFRVGYGGRSRAAFRGDYMHA